MIPLWGILLLGCVIVVLLASVWRIWRIELRVWCIPAAVIEKEAEDLIRQYGDVAQQIAIDHALQAWRSNDSYGTGRWDRVRARVAQKIDSHDLELES